MNFDDILLEILNEYLEDKKIDIEKFCKKYPEYKKDIIDKLNIANFIKQNFEEEDLTGKKLGEYLIIEEIGKGGMGTVFLGIHPGLSRLTAIKILPPSFLRDKEALKNFQEEAKTIAKFNHPNIVPIYSISEEKSLHYIAMGYISGIPLKKIIEQLRDNKQPHRLKASAIKNLLQGTLIEEHDILQKSISLKRGLKFWNKSYYQFVAAICAEIADALSYAHENNIIHGDLKPSNVLLTNEAIPMVVDFGLSRDIKKMASSKIEEFTGTLPYAAPEQIKDNILNKKTDIWSLGVTIYELLTFTNPFRENTVIKTVDKITKGYVPYLRSYDRKIPWELEAIVFKCLERYPENRYNTIAEISTDLNNYLESKPIKAKKLSINRKAYLRIKRYPTLTIVSVILFISLIAVSGYIYVAKLNSLINKADNLRQAAEFKDVQKIYEKVLKLSLNIPITKTAREKALVGIGDILQMNYPLEGLTYYEKCLQINPKNFLALHGKVLVYSATKNKEKEKELLLRILDIYPDDWIAINNYARFLRREGNIDLALNFLLEKSKDQEMLETNPLFYHEIGETIEELYKMKGYKIDDLKGDYYKVKLYLLRKGFDKRTVDRAMDKGIFSISIYRNSYLCQIKTAEELQLLTSQKNILPKNIDESYLKEIAGNNLKLWLVWNLDNKSVIKDSMEEKEKMVDSMKEYFKKNGAIINKPSNYYACLINVGLLGLIKGNSYNPKQSIEMDNILLLNTLKHFAVLEGDYDNGEDKIALIKETLGKDGFEQFKRDNPERLEYFTAN